MDAEIEPEPFKVIDRRGQEKEPRRPAFTPDQITEIRPGADPFHYIAVMPGNHVREVPFRLNSLENQGMKLLSKAGDPKALQAVQQIPGNRKALQAARSKLLRIVEKAMRAHLAIEKAKQHPERVAEAGGVQ